jgi:vacuolar-type H+-ATPase subunit E/Vma4
MAEEAVRSAVLAAARLEAARIEAAARESADRTVAAQAERIRREAAAEVEAGVRALEEEAARRMVLARGRVRVELLERRNRLLRDVVERARDRILATPAPDLARALRPLLAEAAGSHGGRVRCHPADAPLFQELVDGLNQGRDPDDRLVVDTGAPLAERAGFALVTSTFEVDRSLPTVLADLERELLPEIARQLFGADR